MDAHDRARELIDAAHAADPNRTADGRPAELFYADRMETWVSRLVPGATASLRLAARCQHLERWRVPRSTYSADRPGYLAWRKSLYSLQAGRARHLLLEAGVPAPEAEDVALWVSKTGLKTNPGTQALEDAACLVFLESELAAFAAKHADYPPSKLAEILGKTWRKMSPPARELARGLPIPDSVADLAHKVMDPG
jgi:Domain of unknown function (DUF4202)